MDVSAPQRSDWRLACGSRQRSETEKSPRANGSCVSSLYGQMHQDDPDLDQRLTRFEARLDRFSLVLHQWQQSQTANPHDVDERIRTIEATLDREAHALRRMHEEPLRQLQAQAASLREICTAAANSVNGLDRAESRLAALQADVQLHLSDLTRSLEALVTDLRIGTTSEVSTQAPAATWPLERVVHLHHELRRAATGHATDSSPDPTAAHAPAALHAHAASQSSDGTAAHEAPLQLLERGTADESEQSSPADEARWPRRRAWYLAGAVAVIAILVFGLVRIETRLNDAGARAAAAERQAEAVTQLANREAVAARQEANQQIAEARQSAQRAETIGAILTAPDLIRFNLTGGATLERSSAQLLWSRTRGLVLSATRLPANPPEAIYQLWLKTSAEPVSAGLFVPDATGRATLVSDVPPKVVGPVVGAEVTVEPSGGRSAPSGPTLLFRLPQG